MIYWQANDTSLTHQTRNRLACVRKLLSEMRHPIFFDSAGEKSSQARHCYLTAEPVDLFRLPADPAPEMCNWRDRLTTWLASARATLDEGKFSGAFLGYASYDLGRWLERMPSSAANDVPLPSLFLGRYPLAFVYDRDTGKLSLEGAPGLKETAERWVAGLKALESSAGTAKPIGKFNLTSPWTSNMSESTYRRNFEKVQAYIRSGDCYQVNLAQRWQATFHGDPLAAYEALLKHNGAPFSAYLDLGTAQILSVSPERFVAVRDRTCETRPIKGTRPRHPDPAQDEALARMLATADKDRAENVMIVDLLRNDLSRTCKPGSVKVSQLCEVESYPSVHHLVSTVTGHLAEGKTAIELFLNAFPGGSITGAPKIRAMEIIEELEPHRRQAYCGSFIKLDFDGNLDSSIAIRTLICREQQIYCWAGGGLVADSEADLEYQETLDKVSRILPVLSGM